MERKMSQDEIRLRNGWLRKKNDVSRNGWNRWRIPGSRHRWGVRTAGQTSNVSKTTSRWSPRRGKRRLGEGYPDSDFAQVGWLGVQFLEKNDLSVGKCPSSICRIIFLYLVSIFLSGSQYRYAIISLSYKKGVSTCPNRPNHLIIRK
jgi:hypothetical protein